MDIKNNTMKNELIACCGLNCAECDARIATVNNDDELRKKIAEKWRVEYNVAGIKPEMINCTGCRTEGAKIGHCAECEIRNCVQEKNYATCADCAKMETCPTIGNIFQAVPQTKTNLLTLRN